MTALPPTSAMALWRAVSVPERLCITEDGHRFAGDLRLGDLDGNGQCDFLVYRGEHGSATGPAMGGHKPSFLGAFRLDGSILWSVGSGGTQPVRPMSVAVHDLDGDGAAEVICLWHQPERAPGCDWRSLSDVVIQVRDGRTGEVMRQAAPSAITERRCPGGHDASGKPLSIGRQSANWVHQRIQIANFRGTDFPRDLLLKLGDTYVALDDQLEVLWTYQSPWVDYGACPAYIPAVGDLNGDGRDEVNGGYFVLAADGQPLWERWLGPNMDSVTIAPWDDDRMRAICSGLGQVLDEHGQVILALGETRVPHGQEVRVANFRADLPGMEMVIRHQGHNPDVLVVNSSTNSVISELKLNPSPTNVGMCEVYPHGLDQAALLYNGGWLWELETGEGAPLPGLPPPNGGDVHRMGFHHAIAADLCEGPGEELVVWDPTSTEIYIYSAQPDVRLSNHYQAGPRQVNPRIMD